MLNQAHHANIQAKPKIYRGKPQNQIDPQAHNKFVPPNPQRQRIQKNRPTRAAMPKGLPKSTQLQDDDDTKARAKIVEKSPLADSIFAEDVTVREVNLRTLQRPNLAASTIVARETYTQMLIDDSNLSKSWTLESFDYYSTALLWMRICSLKSKSQQTLISTEESLLRAISNQTFNVPEPIRLYLSGIGNVISKTGQHIYSEFPTLPISICEQIPGLYGNRITANNHNDYEEVRTTLGIHIGMIRASLSQETPLPQWIPPIVPAHYVANENLLDFHRIRKSRNEALSILDAAGITETEFPNYPTNSDFNFTLLRLISTIIAGTKTFKLSNISFESFSTEGNTSQLIIERPIDNEDPTVRNINCEVRAESLVQETSASFGMAIAFS